jgi:hypothetical protein
VSSPFETELEKILKDYRDALAKSQHSDASDVLTLSQVTSLQARCSAAIERATGRKSSYYERASALFEITTHEWNRLAMQIGVVDSLLHDIRAGFLKSLEELIHGDVFSDFLEMAAYLNSSGYKDAAAVIAGSTLEAHLKQLCVRHSIPIDSGGKPKKADLLNSELVAANAYSKLDQKNVIAWLGLRNDAAHGKYSEYDKAQVSLLIDGVKHFITKFPA